MIYHFPQLDGESEYLLFNLLLVLSSISMAVLFSVAIALAIHPTETIQFLLQLNL